VTIFGPDLSSYQNGLDLSRLSAASFVIAKTTEGTFYTDSGYQGWRQQAARLGKPFVWYHFLSGEDARAQVAHTLANVGDASLPGMLDVEPAGAFSPTLAQVIAYVDAAHAAGLNLRLVYLPRWFWQELGSPNLTPLADRGLALISSAYPGGSGSPQQLYPGDSAAGWQPYGGMTPALYQYTNQAADGGQALDYNAFKGTAADFAALLGGTTSTGGPDVNLTDKLGPISDGMAAIAPDAVAEGLGAGASFTVGAALLGTTVRQAESLILLKRIAAAVGRPPTVDVVALADALGPLLHPTTDVPALVDALAPHLTGTPDAVAFAAELAPALAARIKVVSQ
jgi:hypothetical protein